MALDPQILKDVTRLSKEPLIFHDFIKWDVLKWNLEDWRTKLGDQPLQFRVGKCIFSEVQFLFFILFILINIGRCFSKYLPMYIL